MNRMQMITSLPVHISVFPVRGGDSVRNLGGDLFLLLLLDDHDLLGAYLFLQLQGRAI